MHFRPVGSGDDCATHPLSGNMCNWHDTTGWKRLWTRNSKPGRRGDSTPQAATCRVVLMHGAGGSWTSFRDWWRVFPGHVEVFAVSLPGRANRAREALDSDVRKWAASLADVLCDMNPTVETALFGHSVRRRAVLQGRWHSLTLTHLVSSAHSPSTRRLARWRRRTVPTSCLLPSSSPHGGRRSRRDSGRM